MPDMLVKLYTLPDLDPPVAALQKRGVEVRRALAPEQPRACAWADEHFPLWTPELDASFARLPLSCYLAIRQSRILGFACYDSIAPNFFGPTGVMEQERGHGVGRALLLACLHAQRAQGYAYAIIGGAGPTAFYERAVGAVAIEGSVPGIYAGMLSPGAS